MQSEKGKSAGRLLHEKKNRCGGKKLRIFLLENLGKKPSSKSRKGLSRHPL